MRYENKILFITVVLMLLVVGWELELNAAGSKRVIMIDPAHGGKEQGVKLTNDVYEKDITLAVALLLKKELASEKNLEVILTRDTDKTVSLEDRTKNINKIKPDFLLSLHVNAGFGKTASGFELYYAECGTDSLKAKKSDSTKSKNKCQDDSVTLAKNIQEHLNALFPRKGRGVHKTNIPVMDDLLIPAVAVEMGFATHPEDKNKLISSKTQADISKALAKSIKTSFR